MYKKEIECLQLCVVDQRIVSDMTRQIVNGEEEAAMSDLVSGYLVRPLAKDI